MLAPKYGCVSKRHGWCERMPPKKLRPASPDLASILPPGVAQGTKAHDSTKKPKPEKAVDDKKRDKLSVNDRKRRDVDKDLLLKRPSAETRNRVVPNTCCSSLFTGSCR